MSSVRGPVMLGNFSRSLRMIARVSSTDSVVWEMKATRSGSSTSRASTSASVSISTMSSGASPIVPSTSSWPAWPISTIV